MFLDGNPKAYNVDKLLEYLANDKSVYMIYLLGIGSNGNIVARLCSVFDERLIKSTNLLHHWAGRNSRGVAQFIGHGLEQILEDRDIPQISETVAENFIQNLIDR